MRIVNQYIGISFTCNYIHKNTPIISSSRIHTYKSHYCINRGQTRQYSNSSLGPYLAGLIEGDGPEKKEMKPLNPYFVTGFSDAESCFYVGVIKSPKVKVGWKVRCSFEIHLINKDLSLLERVQDYFKVGSIIKNERSCKYFVGSIEDLIKIISHFDKYPLITQKHADYLLFKEILSIVKNGLHLTEDGLLRILSIKASMNKGLPAKLTESFPGIVPVTRPQVLENKIVDPHWLAGFTTGDGTFMIRIIEDSNSRMGYKPQLIYSVIQHIRDEMLIRSLVDYLDCGRVFIYDNALKFEVYKFSDLVDKILPFFQKYNLGGVKLHDFNCFVLAVEIIQNKGHFTKEGLEKLRKIKSNLYKPIEDEDKLSTPNQKLISTSPEVGLLHTKASCKGKGVKTFKRQYSCLVGSSFKRSSLSPACARFNKESVRQRFRMEYFFHVCFLHQRAQLKKNNGFLNKGILISHYLMTISWQYYHSCPLVFSSTYVRFFSSVPVLFSNDKKLFTIELGNPSALKVCALNPNFNSYLAGLIEGKGVIAVQDIDTQKVVHRFAPKIIIAFNKHDKPLAEKISTKLNVGKVIDRSEIGHVLLQILAKDEVLKIINLINGYMRTPKIEALHRAINWINKKDNSSIPCLGLDTSPLNSNAWLAGFSDADGCFSITVYDCKKNGGVLRTRVQTSFRIEVKQNYSREVTPEQGGSSFFPIMSEISYFLTVNLYTRTRKTKDKVFYAFAVVAHNSRSHEILHEYFSRFPLYSSKFLAYKDWCLVQKLHKGSLTKENLEKIKEIKSQFNSKRTVFDFSHLNNF